MSRLREPPGAVYAPPREKGIPVTAMGAPEGVAELDATGAVPLAQLPAELATATEVAAGYQPLDVQLTALAGLTYAGNTLKAIRVNAGETGFELATISGGSAAWGGITGTLSDQTDLNSALGFKAPLASPTFTGTVSGITATMVGLSNVTNIAQTSVTGLTGTQSVAAFKTGLSLVKADVGLGSVDNTSDAGKPVSTAQQTALDFKANLASPTFTGTVRLPNGTWIQTADSLEHLYYETSGAGGNAFYKAPTGHYFRYGADLNIANFTATGLNVTGTIVASGAVSGSNLSGTNTGDQNLAPYATTAAVAAAYQPLDTQLTDLAGLVYAGNANKVVRVNAGATAFELVTLAGGGDLLAANNLSDLASAATARTNLSVPSTTRLINTTAPITGGGDLSADRTIAISAATITDAGSMSAADKIKIDASIPAVIGLAGAIGPTIADYFSTTVSLEASSTYEIECWAYFLKTTAGTVVWTWTFSSAPTVAQSFWQAGPVTGFTTAQVNGTTLFGHAVREAATTNAHAATGSLTTAVRHSFMFYLKVRTNAATTLQLRATSSAGTITPQAGSYMRARKIV